MSEIKHTPWDVSDTGYLVDCNGVELADFAGCGVILEDDYDMGAVRCLIVVAPELLEALYEVLHTATDAYDPVMLAKVNAAIAKAEGRE